ncbi:hypothetical protein BDK92_6579 [Micromonospora pisi]|uniref:Uncharacterized protein n=1 Tax=Micromonospora pisi TaxID=589240 RepID=A0A495JUD3_9ACTN|nr:hypothetical protein [Micromonospora pisi]RKR92145.1 hypothetical protein BDK92_6579 [Micromonospora pisi]
MTESQPAQPTRRTGLARRVLPAVGLALLAPWVAEYLMGSHSVRDLPLIVFLVPMYGGGALLVREVSRRAGRGWPTILLLGLAYGVIEAGLLDQSLFNPDYSGLDFQSVAPIPGLRVSAYFTLLFVAGHAIWSIGVPIAIVESLVPDRATTPWLRTPGLVVAALLYLGGGAIIYTELRSTESFQASTLQSTVAAVAALALVVAAFTVPHRHAPGAEAPHRPSRPAIRAPEHRLPVLLLALVVSRLLWMPENWLGVGITATLLAGTTWLVLRWSASPQWSQGHRLALAGGALLVHAWDGFHLHPWRAISPGEELASDILFTLAAITLLLVTIRRVRRHRRRVEESPSLLAAG